MSETYYTQEHEWIMIKDDTATIGITGHAQEQLGDVVFVELPEIGKPINKGERVAIVESVKAASEVYMPLSGEVIENNFVLEQNPALVNESAEKEGWFCKIKLKNREGVEELMNRHDYQIYIAGS